MKIIYFTFIHLFLFLNCLHAQFGCDFINLWSQAEVDSFPQKYSYCNKFYSIQIDDRNGPVNNLDSLSGLTELGVLEINDMDGLSSITGLYTLRKLGTLDFVQKKHFPPFPQLDTIVYLRHIFGYIPSDLSLYQNIKHISERISVGQNGNLSGLPEFTCSTPFSLAVINNKSPNDVSKLIPKNYSDFERISFNANENLSLHGLDSVKIINFVSISGNKNCDFTALHNVREVDRFNLGSQNMYDVQLGVLSKIKKIKFLELYNLENLKYIEQLLPNLEDINTHVLLKENIQLVNIDLLSDFEIPQNTSLYQGINQRIKITNNPNLHDCANDYICRALQVYPDSISLTGNGFNCEKEELLVQCINSTETENNKININLFPNPVVDVIYWDSEHEVQNLGLYDINGTRVLSKQGRLASLDVSILPSGIYFCKLLVDGKVVVRKIVKVGG